MRRTVLPVAAILLTAACGPATHHTSAAASPRPSRTSAKPSSTPTPTHTKTIQRTAKPKPSPSKSKSCGPERDVIVWYKVPGVPDDSAQVVGNYNLITCETTFHELQKDSPTGAGYCTEAAWASDNPGYNADADRAARLKKVQVSVGPAC